MPQFEVSVQTDAPSAYLKFAQYVSGATDMEALFAFARVGKDPKTLSGGRLAEVVKLCVNFVTERKLLVTRRDEQERTIKGVYLQAEVRAESSPSSRSQILRKSTLIQIGEFSSGKDTLVFGLLVVVHKRFLKPSMAFHMTLTASSPALLLAKAASVAHTMVPGAGDHVLVVDCPVFVERRAMDTSLPGSTAVGGNRAS